MNEINIETNEYYEKFANFSYIQMESRRKKKEKKTAFYLAVEKGNLTQIVI